MTDRASCAHARLDYPEIAVGPIGDDLRVCTALPVWTAVGVAHYCGQHKPVEQAE